MNHLLMFMSVICLIACSGCSEKSGTSKPTSGASAEYPIKWTKHVKLDSLDELRDMDAFLSKPVITPNCIETVHMINEGGKKATASTPKEWIRLRSEGFSPATTYDTKAAGWYKQVCLPRMYLHDAVPAQRSYLRDFQLTQDPLKYLPPTLGLGEQDAENKQRRSGGKTWHDLRPTLKVHVEDEYAVRIEDDEEITHVCLLAWGDFDRDGVEDILLDVGNYSKTGSMCRYRMVIVTRKEPGGQLVIIKDE